MGEYVGPHVEYGPRSPRVPAADLPPVGPDVEFGAPQSGPAEPDVAVVDPPVHDTEQADVLEQTEPS